MEWQQRSSTCDDEGEEDCGPVTIKDNTTSAAGRAACSNLKDIWMGMGRRRSEEEL